MTQAADFLELHGPGRQAERRRAEKWLTSAHREFIRATCADTPDLEHSFTIRRDGSIVLSLVGTREEVAHPISDVLSAWLLLHTHPGGNLHPSPADLRSCSGILEFERYCGFGIVAPEGDRLVLMREPRELPTFEVPRVLRWHVGRLGLTWRC